MTCLLPSVSHVPAKHCVAVTSQNSASYSFRVVLLVYSLSVHTVRWHVWFCVTFGNVFNLPRVIPHQTRTSLYVHRGSSVVWLCVVLYFLVHLMEVWRWCVNSEVLP